MANKLSKKQIETLLANMPKPKQAVNAVDNTSKAKPRPEENPASKEAYKMFLGQLQRKQESQKRFINDAGPAPVYKNVGEKVRADLERESRQRDLAASIPNEKLNAWVENVGIPVADIAAILEAPGASKALLRLFEEKGAPEALKNIVKNNVENEVKDELIQKNLFGNKVYVPKTSTTKIAPETIDVLSKNSKISKPYVIEELPGLHLKSTMEGGPISKIIEPKTGLINTDQALAIIGKESNGAEKINLVKQALGENIPKKIDYNEFRKAIQNRLTPLEKNIVNYKSHYGIKDLGYVKRKDPLLEEVNIKQGDVPLENNTILLSNKKSFGRGSNAHGNPNETLGHIHYLIDKETPDVMTATQIQSDAFQGTHRVMPDSKRALELQTKLDEEFYNKRLNEFNSAKPVANEDGTIKFNKEGEPMEMRIEHENEIPTIVYTQEEKKFLKELENKLNLKKSELKNFEEKQLLDKNHQERYLQELVDYAGKKKGINKLRLPTKETAAKIQGYTKINKKTLKNYYDNYSEEELNNYIQDFFSPEEIEKINKIKQGEDFEFYPSKHETILKKYETYPKMIKKLYGEDVKLVTDSKGNTWNEFVIPDKIKKGKGEIKALSTAAMSILGKKIIDKNKNKIEQ